LKSRPSAQVFRPRSNALVVVFGAFMVVVVAGTATAVILYANSAFVTGVGETLQQPVPFSHQHHVAELGIDCRYCHADVDRSAVAGLPPTSTCMSCHSQLWTNAQMLEPVRKSLERDEPLRWNRVHDLADYVYFNHAAHVNNGVGCESCHGRVDRMPLARQVQPLTMSWCLDCHRNPGPNLRPEQAITAMGFDAAAVDSHALLERYGIQVDRLSDCSVCHR